jgi:hypothetical protein
MVGCSAAIVRPLSFFGVLHFQKIVFLLSNRDANCKNTANCRMQLPLTTRLVKINRQEQRKKRK